MAYPHQPTEESLCLPLESIWLANEPLTIRPTARQEGLFEVQTASTSLPLFPLISKFFHFLEDLLKIDDATELSKCLDHHLSVGLNLIHRHQEERTI